MVYTIGNRVHFYDCFSRSYLASSYEAFFIPPLRIMLPFLLKETCLYFYLAFLSFSLWQSSFISLLFLFVSAFEDKDTVFFIIVLSTFYMSCTYQY